MGFDSEISIPFERLSADERQSKSSNRQLKDDYELRQLGKKPKLRRSFGFISMLGFSCTVMTTWEGVLGLLSINLANGGFAGSIYGYLVVWIGVLAAFSTMAELASMAPTAAGQYHWVAILAPPGARAFLSYIVGWLTMTGWQAIVASGFFLVAELIQGLVVIGHADHTPQPWQTMLIFWAVLVLTLLINTVISRVLPHIETLFLVLHVFAFLAVLITMIYFAPHGTGSQVFGTFENSGGFPTQGLSFMVGLVGPAFSLLGPDGPVHMSEEIENPGKNVSRAILFGMLLNGLLGFTMLTATIFCIGDIDTVLNSPTRYPFMAIFQQAVASEEGALALSSLVTTMSGAANISFLATASRMTWSFARDCGTPFRGWLKYVDPRTTIPTRAIGVTVVISLLLSLILLGSSIAFNDVVSLAVSGLYSTYLIGNALLLWRRLKGHITPYNPTSNALRNTSGTKNLMWGPWRISEPLGTIINAFGCCYLLVMLFFSFWPIEVNPSPANMNFSSLMVGSVVIFASIYYFVSGKKTFHGPVVEVETSH